MPNRAEIVSSRWRWWGRNRTKPHVSSHKMPLSPAMWGAWPLRRVRFLLCLALVLFTLSALRGGDLKKEVPHIIAGTHLVWNKRSFARFHPHKRHLDEASQQPFQCKLQAWIAKHNCTAFAIFQIPSRRNRTRRAHKVSRIVARKLFTWENMGFRAIPSSPAVRSPPSWRSCKPA